MQAIHKWLLIGVLLLAGLALLLLPVDTTDTDLVQLPVSSPVSASANRAQPTTQRTSPNRPPRTAAGSDPLEQVLRDIRAATPPASAVTRDAISEQVDTDFNDFLRALAGDERRRNTVRLALEQAMLDISTLTAAVQADLVTSEQLAAIANPNHVLDRVAAILEPDELTRLETYMEDRERNRFLANFSSQVEISVPALDANSREFLLNTWFTERYAAINPYGIGAHSGVGSGLDQQMEAIARTRDSLRMSLTPEQYAIANQFLREQVEAISTVRQVFSGLR